MNKKEYLNHIIAYLKSDDICNKCIDFLRMENQLEVFYEETLQEEINNNNPLELVSVSYRREYYSNDGHKDSKEARLLRYEYTNAILPKVLLSEYCINKYTESCSRITMANKKLNIREVKEYTRREIYLDFFTLPNGVDEFEINRDDDFDDYGERSHESLQFVQDGKIRHHNFQLSEKSNEFENFDITLR